MYLIFGICMGVIANELLMDEKYLHFALLVVAFVAYGMTLWR
jgi:hypothetical protein